MFGDGEGLKSQVKFAVAATYEKFAAKWGLPSDKLLWVDVWAPILDRFTVTEINVAADFCVEQFRRPPVPFEFTELALRYREGRPMSEPIVSSLERLAYLILASDEFAASNVTLSQISDACLIAAAVAHQKEYMRLLPDTDPNYLLAELAGRAQMFGAEAADWRRDAEEGKGYWKEVFLGDTERGPA